MEKVLTKHDDLLCLHHFSSFLESYSDDNLDPAIVIHDDGSSDILLIQFEFNDYL